MKLEELLKHKEVCNSHSIHPLSDKTCNCGMGEAIAEYEQLVNIKKLSGKEKSMKRACKICRVTDDGEYNDNGEHVVCRALQDHNEAKKVMRPATREEVAQWIEAYRLRDVYMHRDIAAKLLCEIDYNTAQISADNGYIKAKTFNGTFVNLDHDITGTTISHE